MRLPHLFLILFGTNFFLRAAPAEAHPVSYQGSVGIISYNSQKMNMLMLNHSVTPRFALAHTYLRESGSEFHIPRLNFLLKRWNEPDSQANFYLSVGTGLEKSGSEISSAHLGEAVLDWESRRYYTSLEHLYIRRDVRRDMSRDMSRERSSVSSPQDGNHTKLRLGFAPFLADYDDLNIWFITQFDKHNDERPIEATQFLRFYHRNVLWEVGAGFDGSIAFNFMIHI